MKKNSGWILVLIFFAGITGRAWASDDTRVIGRIGHNSPKEHLRTASLYLSFNGGKDNGLATVKAGENSRYYSKVWDGLYLQITTEAGQEGVAGYLFSFSRDSENKIPLNTNESRDVPSLRDLASSDFRSDDNFSARPLKPGPGTPDDRGALRVIHYGDFDVEIRVLEFNIGGTSLKDKPFFKSISSLVTVREKA